MKFEDRIEALKRSSQYRRDYKKYDEYRKKHGIVDSHLINNISPMIQVSPRGQTLCKKYQIPYPFSPDEDLQVLPGNQIIPLAKGMNMPAVLPVPLKKKRTGEQVFGLKGYRYLNVSIDVSQPLTDINKAIKTLYKHYSHQIQIDKRHRKTTLADGDSSFSIWDIYDKVEKLRLKHGKLKWTEYMNKLFDINDKVSNDPGTKARYEQLTRAYDKAQDIMVRAEKGLP